MIAQSSQTIQNWIVHVPAKLQLHLGGCIHKINETQFGWYIWKSFVYACIFNGG